MYLISAFSVLCLLIIIIETRVVSDYQAKRLELLSEEAQVAVGSSIQLSADEKIANDILMTWKNNELDDALWNPQYFNLSKHYFTYRDDISKSKVYQIISRMPKGAALHIHSSMMLDVDTLLNYTYERNLFVCFGEEEFSLFFSISPPKRPCKNEWAPLMLVRSMSGNATQFDRELKQYFSLHTQDPKDFINADINKVWKKFDKVYYAIKNLISYRPVREKYIYASLKKFYDDNVMYVEFRTGLHNLYEIDGTFHDKKYSLELYKRVANQFMEDYPDFIGVKIIVTKHRQRNEEQVRDALNMVKTLKSEIPDMIAGFDLVGQEDMGKPLSEFVPVLNEAKGDIDYFFHAGETNWFGSTSDENLFDAILLGSKRIGHAHALIKHPALIQALIKKNIAIEISVISNNVLSLVHDVRNHPLATYLAVGLPVVLSSDDPGAWGAEPLSHDFFVAFMGIASKHADLRLLKKLALNSIEFSALEDKRKNRLMEVFERRWLVFIEHIIATHAHSMIYNI